MFAEQVTQLLRDAVTRKVFPGCVAGMVDHAGKATIVCVGSQTYDADSRAMELGTVFDVASVTKSIPTSSLALQLIDEERLGLDDRLTVFFPEMRHSYAGRMRVRHLLTQTVDFGFHLSTLKDAAPEAILQAIFTHELRAEPGTTFYYSNATSILLGMLVERVSGRRLDDLAAERFFRPLSMTRTTFRPQTLDTASVAPTEQDQWRGRLIHAEIHDESAWKLSQIMVTGSAGLFSTAPDLLTFLRVIVGEGGFGGRRYFSEAMVARMFTNHIAPAIGCTGLGWELNQPRYMGRDAEWTIGKTGFTGCAVMANRRVGAGVVLLSNYIHPRRKNSAEAMNEVRRAVADAAFGATR